MCVFKLTQFSYPLFPCLLSTLTLKNRKKKKAFLLCIWHMKAKS